MFKNRSFQFKMVKDNPDSMEDTPLYEAMRNMTPEQLDELSRKLMVRTALCIGGVLVAKVAVAIVLSAVVKKLDSEK